MLLKIKDNKGYTLLELCIVIVVLGIILGSLLSLRFKFYRASLISNIAEIEKYTKAINTFYVKYGDLPGDVRNTRELGLSVIATDGNRDGLITNYSRQRPDLVSSIAFFEGEMKYFWVHLYNSKMLRLGEKNNVIPRLATNNKIYIVPFSKNMKNYLHIGANDLSGAIKMTDAALTPLEAYLIDQKIDDALPTKGRVRATGGYGFYGDVNINIKCANYNEYILKEDGKYCQLNIMIDK